MCRSDSSALVVCAGTAQWSASCGSPECFCRSPSAKADACVKSQQVSWRTRIDSLTGQQGSLNWLSFPCQLTIARIARAARSPEAGQLFTIRSLTFRTSSALADTKEEEEATAESVCDLSWFTPTAMSVSTMAVYRVCHHPRPCINALGTRCSFARAQRRWRAPEALVRKGFARGESWVA